MLPHLRKGPILPPNHNNNNEDHLSSAHSPVSGLKAVYTLKYDMFYKVHTAFIQTKSKIINYVQSIEGEKQ